MVEDGYTHMNRLVNFLVYLVSCLVFSRAWQVSLLDKTVPGIPNHLRRNDHLLARIPSHPVCSTEHACARACVCM